MSENAYYLPAPVKTAYRKGRDLYRAARHLLREGRYYVADNLEVICGKRDRLTPPKRLVFVGDDDFVKIGNKVLQLLTEHGGLEPDHQILDVGCGIGRVAVPLTRYLVDTGSYAGFDIVPSGIDWCRKNIASRHSNFKFEVADIYNKYYNPSGKYQACEYRFPYPDQSFDFAFLTSVFTHMLRADVENYLAEVARVLKPGGRCFATFFLLNARSSEVMLSGQARFTFDVRLDGCYTVDPKVPETVIAYEEAHIRDLYQRYSLDIMEPIRHGGWSRSENAITSQDIVIAVST
jgi:ubiquinone/menaquinone biosynthesis C-methylase UbiE